LTRFGGKSVHPLLTALIGPRQCVSMGQMRYPARSSACDTACSAVPESDSVFSDSSSIIAHAVLNTALDRIRCSLVGDWARFRARFFPVRAAFPRYRGGSASTSQHRCGEFCFLRGHKSIGSHR
jgi:hypothetical protein